MLAIPLLLGIVAAGRPGAASLLSVPVMLFLFLARYAAMPAVVRIAGGKASPRGFLARRAVWSGAYGACAVAGFAAALAAASAPARLAALAAGAVTLVLGTVHAALALARWDRTLPGEIVGMAGLASGAPLALALSGGGAHGAAVGVGALCLAYFVSTAAFVRAYARLGTRRATAIAACLAAHAGLVAILVAMAGAGWIPSAALLAFAPVVARAAWGLARPPPNVRVLGWREAGVAAAFTAIAAASLALVPPSLNPP
jgi:hypothetical protein